MTNSIMTFSKKKFGEVHGYVNNDGTVYLNVETVLRNLGFVDKNGQIRWSEVNRLLEKFGYSARVGVNDYIPENMFYRLAMKADSPNAKSFQAWLADKVVPKIRKTGYYSVAPEVANPALPSANIRQSNINTRKSFTSIVQLFIYYARNQGDTRPKEKLYSKFSILANQAAGIPNGYRPVSNDEKQVKCKIAENLMGEILLRGMDLDKHFTHIESEVIRKVNDLSQYFTPKLPLLGE